MSLLRDSHSIGSRYYKYHAPNGAEDQGRLSQILLPRAAANTRPKVCTENHLITKVRFDHLRIVLNFIRHAEGYGLSIIHNLNAFANPHDNFHVVLDQQNR